MIYFIQHGEVGAIKIGFTDDIKRRLNEFQTASPAKLYLLYATDGIYEDETELHKKFKEFREYGEWFRPAHDIFNHIIQNAKANHGKIERSYCLFNNFDNVVLSENLDNNLIQIKIYQEVINQAKVLSPIQEKLLFHKIKTELLEGQKINSSNINEQAELVRAEKRYCKEAFSLYSNLVNSIIISIVEQYADKIPDLKLAGADGLCKSIEEYAYLCGYNFSIYAAQRIMRAIAQEIDEYRFDLDHSASDEVMYNIPDNSTAKELYQNFLKGLFKREMARLTPREEIILRSLFFDKKKPQEIAETLGISQSYVGTLKNRAISKLGASLNSKKKKGLFNIHTLFAVKEV